MKNPARQRVLAPLAALLVLVLLPAGARAQAPEPGANALCPVMTDEPVKADKFVDYEGKRVYFCCDRCKAKFQADPKAYLANLPQFGGTPHAPAALAIPPVARAQEAPPPDASRQWADFLGRLHPVVVHFPIGLLLTSAMLELLAIVTRAMSLKHAARACLVLGALGAVAAATFGWISAEFNTFGGSAARALLIHRWVGIAGAAGALATLVLLIRGQRAVGLYRVFLFGTAAVIGIGGHFGGTLVHGENYLFAAFDRPKPLTPAAPAPVAAAAPVAPDGLAAVLFAPDEASAFLARRKLRLTTIQPPPVSGDPDHVIDDLIAAKWQADNLPGATNPPPLCDDAVFVRRVYLDILGTIPTVAESDRFLASTDAAKREKLIDELLARDEDYAAHWTPFWEDALASANTELQGGVPTRGNYRNWIFDSFKANKAFDIMVAELIDPTMPGHQSAVGANANGKVSQVAYIKSETHTDTLQSAANVAQVFLGTSMKCASCHSHFENTEWPQKRFLAFAGIFADHDLEVIRCEKHMGETVAAAFPFPIAGVPTDIPAEPTARLHRLSQLIVDPGNPRFAKAIVNRLWKRYMGLGLFEPVDDFRLERAPSHPELLDWLAYDFMASGYDLKHTIRRILVSRTYQTRYDAGLEDHFDVAKPTLARYYRSPSLRRMTAEQAIDSIRTAATGVRPDQKGRLFRDNTSTALTRTLGRPASRNEISTARPDDVAVVQALELLNGEDYQGLIADAAWPDASKDPAAAVAAMYQGIHSRQPTPAERDMAVEFLKSAIDRAATLAPAPITQEVMLDDALPTGAMVNGGGEWPWVDSESAFAGSRFHRQKSEGKAAQHYFTGAAKPIEIGAADVLFAYVQLDPADPPAQIMLQFNDGSWEHRASWGQDKIMYGAANTPSRRRIGELPASGKWVRLEVPARLVGLTAGAKLSGLSFDQFGGTVSWDMSGVEHRPPNPALEPMADLAWVLFTSPEFQYVR